MRICPVRNALLLAERKTRISKLIVSLDNVMKAPKITCNSELQFQQGWNVYF